MFDIWRTYKPKLKKRVKCAGFSVSRGTFCSLHHWVSRHVIDMACIKPGNNRSLPSLYPLLNTECSWQHALTCHTLIQSNPKDYLMSQKGTALCMPLKIMTSLIILTGAGDSFLNISPRWDSSVGPAWWCARLCMWSMCHVHLVLHWGHWSIPLLDRLKTPPPTPHYVAKSVSSNAALVSFSICISHNPMSVFHFLLPDIGAVNGNLLNLYKWMYKWVGKNYLFYHFGAINSTFQEKKIKAAYAGFMNNASLMFDNT